MTEATDVERGPHPGLKYQYPLPHWADKHLEGEFELYAQLSTRDGRRFGNGLIVQIFEEKYLEVINVIYVVMTDFGNKVALSKDLLERYFYPPEFRMKEKLVEFRQGAMGVYLELEPVVAHESE